MPPAIDLALLSRWSANLKTLLGVVFSVFCISVGTVILAISLSILLEARASRTWPAAEGVVDLSETVFNSSHRGYSQEVKYHFIVGGVRYEGSRLDYNKRSTRTKTESEEMLSAFRKGAQVRVYFDPKAPERNALIPGPEPMTYVPPFMGTFSIIFGLVFLLVTLFRMRPDEPSAACRNASAMGEGM